MSEYTNTLEAYRDHNTDDGEESWIVSPIMALTAVSNELASWPEVRILNPTTGEIFQGGLGHLLGVLAEAVRYGHNVRVEPVKATR